MREHSKANRILSVVLALIGSGGLLLVVLAMFLYAFFSVVRAPELQGFLLIAMHSVPFWFYLYVTNKNWTRNVALVIGLPVHLAWTPLFREFDPHSSLGYFLWTTAAYAVIGTYVLYALSLPGSESKRSEAD